MTTRTQRTTRRRRYYAVGHDTVQAFWHPKDRDARLTVGRDRRAVTRAEAGQALQSLVSHATDHPGSRRVLLSQFTVL
jgi:hypothetical protein